MVLDTILIINPFNFQILNITRMADKKIITLDSLLDKIEPFKDSRLVQFSQISSSKSEKKNNHFINFYTKLFLTSYVT